MSYTYFNAFFAIHQSIAPKNWLNSIIMVTSTHFASEPIARDIALWANMRDGDRNALAQLYKTYFSALRKYGLCIHKDGDLVDDCIHELFSRLWTRRDRISAALNVKVYLFKSLQRILIAQVLHRKREAHNNNPLSDLSSDSSEQLWINGELRKEYLIEIKRCLKSLPKCQREVILLKFFNDLSYVEISEIMNLQVASVYNLISKAIEQLRQKMKFHATAA